MNVGRIKEIIKETLEEAMHAYMLKHGWNWYKYFKSLDKKDVEKCENCGKPIVLLSEPCPSSGCNPCLGSNPPAYCDS
ncbi:MAG: hypothetical protein ACRBG0_27705 [Lewinella sp.]|uniref:hypothetical protein n=1 Tax=Lewinella sp. TaxID=2004506 RepID=UPI003D6AA30E